MSARHMRRRSKPPTSPAVLALTIVCTAAAIGLYRPEICIERRRLLINAGVAGLLAFPAVLVVSGSFNIGLSRHAVVCAEQGAGGVAGLHHCEPPDIQPDHAGTLVRPADPGAGFGTAHCPAAAVGDRSGAVGCSSRCVAARDAGAGVVDQPLSLAALRRQRIWGIVVAGSPR